MAVSRVEIIPPTDEIGSLSITHLLFTWTNHIQDSQKNMRCVSELSIALSSAKYPRTIDTTRFFMELHQCDIIKTPQKNQYPVTDLSRQFTQIPDANNNSHLTI